MRAPRLNLQKNEIGVRKLKSGSRMSEEPMTHKVQKLDVCRSMKAKVGMGSCVPVRVLVIWRQQACGHAGNVEVHVTDETYN